MTHKQLFYQDPQITYPIYDLKLSFSDYLEQCKQIITNHRQDLYENRDLKINANCPFELRPTTQPNKKRYGALLIHGLFDSPFMMKDLGERLAAEGLLVRSILLPGHGTVPGALLNVSDEDWIQTVQYGITAFSKEVDQLFLVGFSLGGVLAAYQASQNPTDFIAGLILLAPAFAIKSKLACLAKWFCSAGNYINWAKWLYLREELDYVKYHTIAFNAVNQAYQLTKKIKMQNNLTQDIPQFLALTLDDKTIDSRRGLTYFSKTSHKKNRLILYANHDPKINDTRIIQRQASYPKQHILDIAHIGLTIPASNSHYGSYGDYPYASHTQDQPTYLYDEINPIERSFYDFLYKIKLTRHKHRRLTYNPDFEFLMREMINFITSVCI